MAKTLQVRVDEDTKSAVELILSKLGLDMSTAIRLYLSAILLNNGIPFDVRLPFDVRRYNSETIQAIEDTIAGRNLYGPFDTVDEMTGSLDMEKEDTKHAYRSKKMPHGQMVAEETDHVYKV